MDYAVGTPGAIVHWIVIQQFGLGIDFVFGAFNIFWFHFFRK